MKRFLIAVVVMLTLSSPALAQSYTGWIEHPFPNVGYWWCDWYKDGGIYEGGYSYWSQTEDGQWLLAEPDWYNEAAAAVELVFPS